MKDGRATFPSADACIISIGSLNVLWSAQPGRQHRWTTTGRDVIRLQRSTRADMVAAGHVVPTRASEPGPPRRTCVAVQRYD